MMQANHFTEKTDASGRIYIAGKHIPNTISCFNKEIIKVHNRVIDYPHDTIRIKQQDITHSNQQDVIALESLMPPIIINLRHNAHPHERHTRKLLSHDEIAYFKQNGQNATIFIHGFNLSYGHFAHQIERLNYVTDVITDDGIQQTVTQVIPITSNSDRTVYRDVNMIQQRFGEVQQHNYTLCSTLTHDQWLNGTGAHNWFVHMEDNLNRATGQFNRQDYRRFTRMINVTWSGDISILRYITAEEPAASAGKALLPLILQLQHHGIEVNVIAHSLGCRVLLSLMHQLALARKDNILNKVIFWQAAIPANALSDNPQHDRSIKQNWQFHQAYRASRHINILYSKHDWVLWISYAIANQLGIEPTFKQKRWEIRHKYLKSRKQRQWQALLNDAEHLFGTSSALQLLDSGNDAAQSTQQIEQLRTIVMEMQQRLAKQYQVQQALGYAGPDDYTRKLLKDKLIAAEQPMLSGHSAMKIPSAQLMRDIYQQYIVGGRHGICRFGHYQLGE